MKERLEQLTVAEFVDLLCGDTDVLRGRHMIVSPEKLEETARNIVWEYKEIADPAGTKAYLADGTELVKMQLRALGLEICQHLVVMERYDKAREILGNLGLRANSIPDARLAPLVKSRLLKCRAEIKKLEDSADAKEEGEVDIRREFDMQTAALMAHFKFQIDPGAMKASVYAHLIARYNAEIKVQLESLKKYKQ